MWGIFMEPQNVALFCANPSEFRISVVASNMPTLFLLPSFQIFGHLFDKMSAFNLFNIIRMLLRCKKTSTTTKTMLLCFQSLKFPFTLYIHREKWKKLRASFKRSDWATLVYRRQPYQIIQALRNGNWTKIERNPNPKRRKIK
jgi:hypothetical protein